MLLKGSVIISMVLFFAITVLKGNSTITEPIKSQEVEASFKIAPRVVNKIKMTEEDSQLLLVDKGIVELGYRLEFEEDYAMLSRDGSECQSVTNGMELTLPGTYFLTTTNKANQLLVTKLKIASNGWKDTWQIANENELDEILKAALESFHTNFSIQFNYGEFTVEEINQVLFAHIQKIIGMYPKLTFESYIIRGVSGDNPVIDIEINYPLEQIEKLKEYDKAVDKKIIDILSHEIDISQEDYEREWVLFEYLISSTEYALEGENHRIDKIDGPMIHTLFGTVIDGKAVCDGYAKTMMYLLNAVGVQTHLVFGEAEGIAHVWNQVNIQGEYYHLDATWGDIEEKQLGGFYNYFNETDDYMLKTHEWEQDLFIACENELYSFPYLPIQIEEIAKVREPKEWRRVLNKVQKDNIEEQSLILYNQTENNWDTREIISDLCNTLKKSLEYNIVEKYDTLIINYKVYQ